MKVYLIRHAKSEDWENGLRQKDDSPIITEGVDFTKYKTLNPNKVFSSPVTRAQQTAKMLFGEYEILDYIHEYVGPKFLYGVDRKIGEEFWKQNVHHAAEDSDWTYDGCESFNMILARVKKLHGFLKNFKNENIVVVGHGTFFRHFLGYNSLKESYTFKHFQGLLWHVCWENLEMKEIELEYS